MIPKLKAAAAAPNPPEVATRYAAMTESNLDNFTSEAEQVLGSWWRQKDSEAARIKEAHKSKKRAPPTDSEETPEAQRQKTASATDSGAEVPMLTAEGQGATVPAADGNGSLDDFVA